MRFWTGDTIKELQSNQIFVYDSNPQGSHNKDMGYQARKFGALYGIGRGLQGNTYGLVTKNLKANYTEKSTGIKYILEGAKSVSVKQIQSNIDELYECANNNPDKYFIVGYKNELWPEGDSKKQSNGYTGEEMFNLFTNGKTVPSNIILHESFKSLYKNSLDQKQEIENSQKYIVFAKSGSTFSLWHPAKIEYKDMTFSSAGQFLLYSKAKLFGDERTAQKIMNMNKEDIMADFIKGTLTSENIMTNKLKAKIWESNQQEIKELATGIVSYNDQVWKDKIKSILGVAIREKYNQNNHLREHLISIKNKKIIYATPTDRLLGAGVNKSEVLKSKTDNWPGDNLLGNMLNDLKDSYKLKKLNKPKL